MQSTPTTNARRGRALARWATLALLMAVTALPACAASPKGPQVTVHAAKGDATVTVELALNEDEQARGLMWRSELAEDAGMLFVFDSEEERAFWMRNTPIPLDILYITSGLTVRSIAAMTKPYSEAAIPSRGPCLYVLEVPGGWAERHGVRSDDKVTLPELPKSPRDGTKAGDAS